LPYAKDVDADAGGVIQCFIDLDEKQMSFGYNGTHLGIAFEDFDFGNGIFAAVSTNLENECRLNFGLNPQVPFRFPQNSYAPLGYCVFK